MRCRYSSIFPVEGSITELQKCVRFGSTGVWFTTQFTMYDGLYESSDLIQLPAVTHSPDANEGGGMVVGTMICGNDVESSWSADGVRDNDTLGVGMRSGCTFGVGNDVTMGCGVRSRRVRWADFGTNAVLLGVSGMMYTLRDTSVTGGRFRGSSGTHVGRLRRLQRNEQVIVAPGANVAGDLRTCT